jgi:ribosome-associated protein
MSTDLFIDPYLTIPGWCLTVTTSRSGGPGGQSVNTTDSKVHLAVHLDGTPMSTAVKERLRRQYRRWVTDDGGLMITCDVHKSQHRNVEEARERLANAVRDVLHPPPPRRPTKPTRGSQKRRVEAKKGRGVVKKLRGKVETD